MSEFLTMMVRTMVRAKAEILEDLKCPFVINQNRYSIFDRTIEQNGLKKTANQMGKGIIAFSPLAQGLRQINICTEYRQTAGLLWMEGFYMPMH